MAKITVAKYLQLRLEELGLDHVFGVAGNYSAAFLNTIIEDPKAKIKVIGNTNEINAGHCVDAYARLKGLGAVGVTYGVGAFSVLNPVAGSYVEHNAVLVINGAPTEIDFTTSIMGKSIVSEDHPRFKGIFNGKASPSDIFERFTKAGVKIGLGAWTTGKNLGGFNIWDNDTVLANHSGVRVGAKYYPNVPLRMFMAELKVALTSRKQKYKGFDMEKALSAPLKLMRPAAIPDDKSLTYDLFFSSIDSYLTNDHTVVVDAGFPLLGAQGLHRGEANTFISQASWLSIGYSVPAAIGIKCAMPGKRVLTFVGDGAFQETCQAVSTQHHLNQNTVVFVLDNKIYGIEQMQVNPNPFRGKDKVDYPQPDLNKVYPYNDLNNWNYAKLTDAFGGRGLEVSTCQELAEALKTIDAHPNDNFIVHVHLPKTNIPESIAYRTQSAGEDETLNPDWSLC